MECSEGYYILGAFTLHAFTQEGVTPSDPHSTSITGTRGASAHSSS